LQDVFAKKLRIWGRSFFPFFGNLGTFLIYLALFLWGDGVIIFLFNRSFRSKRICKLLECASFRFKMYYIILHVITNATEKALEVVILENEGCSRYLRYERVWVKEAHFLI